MFEIGQYFLEIGCLLVVFALNCCHLLRFQLFINRPEKWRCVGWNCHFVIFFKRSCIVADLYRFAGLILAAIFLSEVDSFEFLMSQHFPNHNQVFNGHLVEQISVVFVVLVKDQPDMRAGELEVQGFFLPLLKRRLWVVVGWKKAKLAVFCATAHFDEHFHHLRDFILVKKQL